MKMHRSWIRRIISLCLLVLLLSTSVVPALAAQGQQGSSEASGGDVIEISSEADLLELAANCKLNSYSLGKTVVLTQDIQVYSPNFNGIPFFNGTFNGNGHTISRISLTAKGSNQGFFRYLGNQAVVRDLNISGQVMPSGSQENVGGIAGCNYGTISGCSFVGSVNGESNVGAIAGTNKSTGKIVNCTSRAVLVAVTQTGGIAGDNQGLISSCSSESGVNVDVLEPSMDLGGIDIGTLNLAKAVTNRTNLGGIAGTSSGIITGCTNTGTVGYASSGYNVGGIAGSQNGVVTNCENRGEIYGRKDVGGIVGQAQPYMELVYFQSRLSSATDQIDQLNQTMQTIAPTMGDTSNDMFYYMRLLVGQYTDMFNTITEDMNDLNENMDEADVIGSEMTDATEAISDILSKYNMDSLPEFGDQEEMDAFIEQLNADMETIQGYFDVINEQMDLLEGSLSETGDSAEVFMNDLLEQMNDQSRQQSINEMIDTLEQHMQDITGVLDQTMQQVESLTNSLESALEGDLDELSSTERLQDISSLKSAEDSDGVITSSRNYGTIHGDLNTGGIVGSMNVDYEEDQETDADMSSLNLVTRINASSIVADSINYGKVEVKKQQAGGVAGLQELGIIYRCESYGNVTASGGEYVGGIAGNSMAAIQNSYTRSQITGQDHVGGIAGSASTLVDSVAIAYLEADGECIGSVAGDVADEGSISGNYFVGEDYGAIDDISYSQAAEPVAYEELMTWPQIPEGFHQVTVTFEDAEGETLSEVSLAYGSALPEEAYPEVEAEDGCYIRWNSDKTLDRITENVVVTAESVPWTKSVAGDLHSEDGRDLFLLVGEFYDNTRIYLTETDGPEGLPDDAQLLYAYTWTLVSDQEKEQDQLTGHFYAEGQTENAVLYLKRDGVWTRVDAAVDSSYLVADIAYGEAFAVVVEPENAWMQYVLLVIFLAVTLIAAVVIIRILRRRKREKEAEDAGPDAGADEETPDEQNSLEENA